MRPWREHLLNVYIIIIIYLKTLTFRYSEINQVHVPGLNVPVVGSWYQLSDESKGLVRLSHTFRAAGLIPFSLCVWSFRILLVPRGFLRVVRFPPLLRRVIVLLCYRKRLDKQMLFTSSPHLRCQCQCKC